LLEVKPCGLVLLKLYLDFFHPILRLSELLCLRLEHPLLVDQEALGFYLQVDRPVADTSVLLGLVGVLFVDIREDLVLLRLVLRRRFPLALRNFIKSVGYLALALLKLDLLLVQGPLASCQLLLSH